MKRVPSFQRVNSRANRTGLEAMDHGILALIVYDLNYEHQLTFLQTCREFSHLKQIEPGLEEELEDVHTKYEFARKKRDEQVSRERKDFCFAITSGIAIVIATFILQAGFGSLFIYTAYRIRDHGYSECGIDDTLETMGWLGIGSWALGIVFEAARNHKTLSRALCAGRGVVGSAITSPQVKFDLEIGEPLLEEDVDDDETGDVGGNAPRLVLCTMVLVQLGRSFVGFASIWYGGHIWYAMQYEDTQVRGDCGEWAYTMTWWCNWLPFTIMICIIPLYCVCCCCICAMLFFPAPLRRLNQVLRNMF